MVVMSQREICQPLVCGGVVWSPNAGCNLKLHMTAPLTVGVADQRSLNLLPNLDI